MRLLRDKWLLGSSEIALIGLFSTLCFSIFVLPSFAQNVKQADGRLPFRSGKSDAIAKVEVYYDLQCPSCANFHSILKVVENKFGDKVSVTFRHFPLDIPAHDKAFLAARVVEAARVQGKGREMLDLIMANQANWTATKSAAIIFVGYATALKLNIKHFREDFESDSVIHGIVNDIERAKTLGVKSVPTIFVNGKELTYAEALDLETIIQNLVK